MRIPEKRQKGLSLIEMMIALVIAAMVIAGVYRTFTIQQRSFVFQEQVSEAQQNVRAVMDLVAYDIRMAGFGMPAWAVGGVANEIRIDQGSPADFTIVGVFSAPIATLSNDATMGQSQIILNTNGQSLEFTAGDNLLVFESDRAVLPILPPASVLAAPLTYKTVVVWGDVSGINPTISIDSDGSTAGTQDSLDKNLRTNALVYRVGTVRYQLNGTTLLRNGSVLANNVNAFQITDLFNAGPPAVAETFGSYQVVLTVTTQTNDPDFPGGVRVRTLRSTIKARNLVYSG
ncbi:MAG: prepilin-type N-terminal cleavage/methylation domain-containing protein [Proteobacteria bacterium]|nr:prepilin-type N-terminal cleavage/methylation domain-containing protein [Pseudomonadota bacterium]NIS69461.1 prepilin-type N-terminal cleavage/methylation domain-containing protein [Pseudomonadota bacterium]